MNTYTGILLMEREKTAIAGGIAPKILNPLNPQNLAPVHKTYTEGGKTFIVNGKATVCIIKFNDQKFKGVAKCSPEDAFAELIGKTIAEARAEQKRFKWIEKHPNEGWIYEAAKLKQAGKPFTAMKVVRNHTGWGLRESKNYVDNVL